MKYFPGFKHSVSHSVSSQWMKKSSRFLPKNECLTSDEMDNLTSNIILNQIIYDLLKYQVTLQYDMSYEYED